MHYIWGLCEIKNCSDKHSYMFKPSVEIYTVLIQGFSFQNTSRDQDLSCKKDLDFTIFFTIFIWL